VSAYGKEEVLVVRGLQRVGRYVDITTSAELRYRLYDFTSSGCVKEGTYLLHGKVFVITNRGSY